VRILVLNWQDYKNPQAGGAELHLKEVFGRIVASGHQVDLLCSSWDGASPREKLDGIEVHRIGSRHTYPFVAHRYFNRNLRANDYDVVVEDLNKVPLFTPLWGLRKVVALVHHLFGSTAFREATAPVAAAVWLSERPIGMVYRAIPFEAVSASTANDLAQRGIPRRSIRVIYNGVDSRRLSPNPTERSDRPLFVYLGRLKKYKRVDIVIRAFAELNVKDATLEIAGTGDYRASLEGLVNSLGLSDRVRFLGFVPEDEKVHVFRRAWASTLASPKEGWGISNLEAAACGTPVIAANSPGIRESVIDGETGFLVPQNDIHAMAASMRGIVESRELVDVLGAAARRFAETFTWERAANETLSHLTQVAESR
jgi:glycosyltransferase involved in cell wall biosynthesis